MSRYHYLALLLLAMLALAAAVLWRSTERTVIPDAPAPPAAPASPDAGRRLPADPGTSPSRRPPQRGAAAGLTQAALNAWAAGDIAGAVARFEQAVAAAPDDAAAHSHFGRLLTLAVSYERAQPLLLRASELNPDDAQVWLDLATLYERMQRLDKSWRARERAAELVGAAAIRRDARGRFVVAGTALKP